jgi:hypothetical protein
MDGEGYAGRVGGADGVGDLPPLSTSSLENGELREWDSWSSSHAQGQKSQTAYLIRV